MPNIPYTVWRLTVHSTRKQNHYTAHMHSTSMALKQHLVQLSQHAPTRVLKVTKSFLIPQGVQWCISICIIQRPLTSFPSEISFQFPVGFQATGQETHGLYLQFFPQHEHDSNMNQTNAMSPLDSFLLPLSPAIFDAR